MPTPDPGLNADRRHDHAHLAGAEARFTFLGGRLAIDFVNTVANWRGPEHPERFDDDKLASYPDLVAWAKAADVLPADAAGAALADAARRPDEAAAVLARARALRLALHDLLTASLDGARPDPADLAVVDAEVRAQLRASALVLDDDGFVLAPAGDGSALDCPLWPVAHSAIDLLTDSADLAKVRVCAADVCGWMFFDTSGGRRRWCSMADCGNAAKVRRFRKRRRGEAQ